MTVARPLDPLEAAVRAGAINALRRRAEAIRKLAAPGISALDGYRPAVVVITSESATALKIARSWDAIAAKLEAEAA